MPHELRVARLDPKKLRVGSLEGVKAIVEALGGVWGKSRLEDKFERFERAIYSTVQRADETHESYLARHDHQFEELLSMKVGMDEFRAYILLRNSALSSEDKKRLIVESQGSLEYREVVSNLKLLGSRFFHEVHSSGKQNNPRTKTYEANAFMAQEADGQDQASEEPTYNLDDWTEEEWIESLANDEDATMIMEYESTMLDAVQDNEDLALTQSSYMDARRRLSERFKSRGFWPTSQNKGKGKGGETGKRSPYSSKFSGNRKSLQQRIMESSCRICGRKGHWKAACPQRGSQSAPSTAVAPTLVTVNDELDALPLEFMDLPELTEGTLNATQENSKHFFCVCESRDTGVLGGLWKTNEGDAIVLTHKGGMITECENFDVRTSLPESAFASTAQSPEAKSMHDTEASAFSSFSTRDALGIVDTGATKTVIGSSFVANLLAALRPEVRKQVQRCRCWNQGTLESQHALVVPSGPLKLKIAIVPGRTPFLLSNTLLRAIGATVDVSGEVIKSTLLKRNIPIQLNAKGLFLVDLNDLITPTSQDAEAEPAETFATLNCKSLPSVSVQEPGQVQSKAKTMTTQNFQVRTGLVTSRIQQFEAATPESTKTQTNPKKPNERSSVRGDEKVSFESVPRGAQPGCNHTRATNPFVRLSRITITPTSEASALSARLARVLGEEKKEEARDQFEAFKLLSLDEMGQTKIDFGSAHLGRTYSEMWEKEAKYVRWFQASYHSSNKVNHQKFIHYISLRVTYAEHQLCLNSQDPRPSPSQRPLHPAIKSNAKAKPIQEVTPQDLADLAEDESWEPVQEIEIQPEIYTEMAAMDTRLQTIEGAMQEIIAHLRAS